MRFSNDIMSSELASLLSVADSEDYAPDLLNDHS